MPRTYLLVCVTLVAAGCSSPLAPTPSPAPVALAAGNYSLNLDPGNVSGGTTFCVTSGGEAPHTSISIPVVVQQDGSGWSARPTADADRGLVITLSQTASAFMGTATGAASDGTKLATFGRTQTQSDAVQLLGPPVSTNLISGYTSGQIGFSSTGGTSFCSSFAWVLVPR